MRFFHSGDLGDLIYAVPSMRALCAADGTKADIYLGNRDWTRANWTDELFGAIAPLLRVQDFVSGVIRGVPAHPFTDFSTFRNGGYKLGDTIFERQRRWVRADADIAKPWLQVPPTFIKVGERVAINRTPRWEGWFFPWKEIVGALDGALLFIGLASEHEAFCREFGSVDFSPTANLLEAAGLIAGSAFFIGNQSACGAIANGLHKPMLTEVCAYACDCILPRPNAHYCLDGWVNLEILGRKLELPAKDASSLKELEAGFYAKARSVLRSNFSAIG